ncbi:MAG: GNAT family N-acetyltransferase [Tenuifilaceae bacterium]|jgi:diamine N-acetyltransferase|nr:GNAT family N-acetyltransferase [Bacteroidales bacterium]MDI9515547.1 GNAT family N-acetyltransferase [Bacteroidota bacterium]NLH57303.1 GNAT family N-acetyltransferase [Rikenellaceae bacterium]OQC63297.1 MAG: Spermidine N(1)-acetyltransferase [Bacteroidetes bacterium ADurb.Bin008]HNV82430.1 GNAT family N-acetyltransferase [Tenuifilaceae bacterium]
MLNTLESNLIKLRAPEPSDLELLYTWENNMEIWKVSNTHTPYSKYVLKKYIESSHLDIWESKQLRLIIEAKTQSSLMLVPVGTVDLFDFDPFHLRAGVGILIANKEHRQKGYATEALKLLMHYSFETLQLHQLYCNVSHDNFISLQLFKNAGFAEVGIKKDWTKTANGWMDEIMLQAINPLHDISHS